MEAVGLRIQDIDFDYLSLKIWHGKGNKHRRVTMNIKAFGYLMHLQENTQAQKKSLIGIIYFHLIS